MTKLAISQYDTQGRADEEPVISVSLADNYRRLPLGGEVPEARQTGHSRKPTIGDALPGKRKLKGYSVHALERRTVEGSGRRIKVRRCSVGTGAMAAPTTDPKDAPRTITALQHGASTFSAIYDSSGASAVMWSTHGRGPVVPFTPHPVVNWRGAECRIWRWAGSG